MRVYLTRTDAEAAKISAANAEATLQAGFTSVRNVGTYIGWSDRALRDAINRGEVAGPRMQVVGFYLTIPGGGGDLFGIPGVPEATYRRACAWECHADPRSLRAMRSSRSTAAQTSSR